MKAEMSELKQKLNEKIKGKESRRRRNTRGPRDNRKNKFPKELEEMGPPADPDKPHVIDEVEYWYCKKHGWCKHTTKECNDLKKEAAKSKKDKMQALLSELMDSDDESDS